MSSAIALHGVSKQFRNHAAVADLDLHVQPGEIVGFLGPNGAGKTTTIRLITGFLHPTRGTIHVLGRNIAQRREALAVRENLGFVPDVAGLDPAATGARLLDDLARLQGRPPIDQKRLCVALDLQTADLHRPIRSLSRGTRQKINLVQGMQHQPDLLILDEPTEGLDPLGKQALFDLLRDAHRRGTTIFFSSHVLSEVEELCDRVALIRGGRLIAVDRIAALRRQLQRRVTLQIDHQPALDVHAALAALPTVRDLQLVHGAWHFTVTDLPPLLRLLATLPVRDISIAPPSLADVFLRYYRAPKRDNA